MPYVHGGKREFNSNSFLNELYGLSGTKTIRSIEERTAWRRWSEEVLSYCCFVLFLVYVCLLLFCFDLFFFFFLLLVFKSGEIRLLEYLITTPGFFGEASSILLSSNRP